MPLSRLQYIIHVQLGLDGKYYYVDPSRPSVSDSLLELSEGKQYTHPKKKKKLESCFYFSSFRDFKVSGITNFVAIIQAIVPPPTQRTCAMYNGQVYTYTRDHLISKRNGYFYSDKIQVNRILSLEKLIELPDIDPLSLMTPLIRCPIFKMMKSKEVSYGKVFKVIEKDGSLIKKIENPGKDLEFLSVRQNPDMIEHVSEETQDLQIMSLQSNPSSLANMKNPSYLTLLLAVALNPKNLDLIQDPPDIFKRVASSETI